MYCFCFEADYLSHDLVAALEEKLISHIYALNASYKVENHWFCE